MTNSKSTIEQLEDARIAAWDAILRLSGPGVYITLRYNPEGITTYAQCDRVEEEENDGRMG